MGNFDWTSATVVWPFVVIGGGAIVAVFRYLTTGGNRGYGWFRKDSEPDVLERGKDYNFGFDTALDAKGDADRTIGSDREGQG